MTSVMTNGAGPTTSSATDAQLFDESFHIDHIDSGKYDRVSRITAQSVTLDVTITLDINTQLFPVSQGDSLNLVLASTLSLDGAKDDGKGWRETMNQATLADMFDYVCHGKVYRFEGDEDDL